MGLFVAALVVIIGAVLIISGIDGTGLSLFQAVIGTPKNATTGTDTTGVNPEPEPAHPFTFPTAPLVGPGVSRP